MHFWRKNLVRISWMKYASDSHIINMEEIVESWKEQGMNYQETANEILFHIGGAENIREMTHCFTRLRFELRDPGKADRGKIERIEGVIAVVESSGQFQVVMGTKVGRIYDLLKEMTGTERKAGEKREKVYHRDSKDREKNTPGSHLGNRMIQSVSSMFTPMVPAIAASGLLKGFLTIARMLASNQGIDITGNHTYVILLAATDAIFYFMPIILAYTSARVFGANEFVAMALGGTMCYPSVLSLMTGEERISMLGVALTRANYTSSVIPIIIGVFILAYVQRFLERVIPEVLKIILVPGLSLLVMVPAVFVVFGPVGIYLGNIIHFIYTGLMGISPVLCGGFIGGMWCVFVIFGAHRALVPIGIQDVALNGRQNLLAFAGAANFSQGGAALGVMMRTRSRELKAVAASASVAASVCGITEPAIYGCNLRLKRPMIYAVICGAAGGAVMGAGGVYGDAFANNGILTLATYAAFGMKKFLFYLAGIGISFFGSAILTMLLGFEDMDQEPEETSWEGN